VSTRPAIVPSSRKSRSRVIVAAGQADAVGVEAHGAAEVAGLGQRVDLERPQDGAAAGDDLDRQHAVGGRERGEVDVHHQLDLGARRELGGLGVQRQRRVGGREAVGQRLGAVVAEDRAGLGLSEREHGDAIGERGRCRRAGVASSSSGRRCSGRAGHRPRPRRTRIAAGTRRCRSAARRSCPRRSRRPAGRGRRASRGRRAGGGAFGSSGWVQAAGGGVGASWATSSGVQASDNNRADAAARNIEVRFTANSSCGAHRSAAMVSSSAGLKRWANSLRRKSWDQGAVLDGRLVRVRWDGGGDADEQGRHRWGCAAW
jgi:hypothetical protein